MIDLLAHFAPIAPGITVAFPVIFGALSLWARA